MERQPSIIQPGEPESVNYWTRKLGVNAHRINEAILYTGTLEIARIKEYLNRDSWVHHPRKRLTPIVRSVVNYLF